MAFLRQTHKIKVIEECLMITKGGKFASLGDLKDAQ